MSPKRNYSKLTLPCDASYVRIADTYVKAVAEAMALPSDAIEAVAAAVREAADNVLRYAYPIEGIHSFDITCESISEGLLVVVKDYGIPFDPHSADVGGGFSRMRELVDLVTIHNLGPHGKEIHLVKFTQAAEPEAADATKDSPPAAPRSKPPEEFTIRLFQPADALEVSRSIYKTYGFSYPNEHMYFPQRLIKLNETGRVLSVVAVTPSGDVAGHCAAFGFQDHGRTAELGQAAVKPEYRGAGCLRQMSVFLIDECVKRGMTGLYVRAVTAHPYSQNVAGKLGFVCCGIVLAFASTATVFLEIRERLSQRESFVAQFRYIQAPEPVEIFAPERHAPFIARIYEKLGCRAILKTTIEPRFAGHSILKITMAAFMPEGFAKIDVIQCAEDVAEKVQSAVKGLLCRGIRVVSLSLNMKDPLTYYVVPQLEEQGFFFSCVTPGTPERQTLTLQYLHHILMDYDAIATASPWSQEVLDYVRSMDRNQE